MCRRQGRYWNQVRHFSVRRLPHYAKLAVIVALLSVAQGCDDGASGELHKVITVARLATGVSPDVDYVQIDEQPVEKFSLDRAVLTVPTTIAQNPVKLAKLLRDLSLQSLAADAPTERRATRREPAHRSLHGVASRRARGHAQQAPRDNSRATGRSALMRAEDLESELVGSAPHVATDSTTSIFVGLPRVNPSVADDVIRRELPGHRVSFGSENGKSAFAYILKYRREHAEDPGNALTLDFVVDAASLLTTTKEGRNFPGMHEDDYWRVTKLREAWTLALAATPRDGAAPVTIAVIDQGFVSEPVGMSWDYVLGNWHDLDKPAYVGSTPWHGTDCASIAGAAVNDGKGAAGTSLLSPTSQLPSYAALPRIRTVPAILPAGPVSFKDVSDMIRLGLAEGVDVISVSHALWCGFFCSRWGSEKDLVSALEKAEQARVAVVFAAGNDSKQLPDSSWWNHLVGCDRGGKALCVGAVDRQALRMDFSNWGPTVATYAPGDAVAVSALPSSDETPAGNEEEIRHFSGTSASAPFVAGIIALAQAVWGQRIERHELRQLLANASRIQTTGTSTYAVPVLDASLFLRQKLTLRQDRQEPNDTLSDVAHLPSFQPLADSIYSLHSGTDVDVFPLQLDHCSTIAVDVTYVADVPLAAVSLDLRDETGKAVAQGKLQGPGHIHLDASPVQPKPRRYYLAVSNNGVPGAETPEATAYDLSITSSRAQRCGQTSAAP